ncbi:hypothetical protein ATANTOWER_032004 [Ataeniobius toweri]|uniref:Uncharacterized protein n=1 Tax=Ataeniobius toweri TaxID=208326 RepID=A0ABU7CCB9_9TELE|nr:hypothetical protein [Ataeniobius toweri]
MKRNVSPCRWKQIRMTAEDTDVELRTHPSLNARKSAREVKPVICLTYDKLGTQAEEPVTIVHQGMVIQLNLGTRDKSNTVKHFKHSNTRPSKVQSKLYG